MIHSQATQGIKHGVGDDKKKKKEGTQQHYEIMRYM